MTEKPPPQLLETIGNLADFHREHEKFSSQASLRQAVDVQAASRVLKALADRWGEAVPADHPAASPFAGARDLNPPGLAAEEGVLFMEGEGEPAEIKRLRRDLETLAGDFARLLRRALDLIAGVDFAPQALRAELTAARRSPAYLYGDGPRLRLVEATVDAIRTAVWKVSSLSEAVEWLKSKALSRRGRGRSSSARPRAAPRCRHTVGAWLTFWPGSEQSVAGA